MLSLAFFFSSSRSVNCPLALSIYRNALIAGFIYFMRSGMFLLNPPPGSSSCSSEDHFPVNQVGFSGVQLGSNLKDLTGMVTFETISLLLLNTGSVEKLISDFGSYPVLYSGTLILKLASGFQLISNTWLVGFCAFTTLPPLLYPGV